MSEPTNANRAGWAREAVNVFAKRTFGGDTFDQQLRVDNSVNGDAFCAAQDLVTNIMHLADQLGWDPSEVIRRARENYAIEKLEESESDVG